MPHKLDQLYATLTSFESFLRDFHSQTQTPEGLGTGAIKSFLDARNAFMLRIAELVESGHNVDKPVALDDRQEARLQEALARIDALTEDIIGQCQLEKEQVKDQMQQLRAGRVAIRGYGGFNRKRNNRFTTSG